MAVNERRVTASKLANARYDGFQGYAGVQATRNKRASSRPRCWKLSESFDRRLKLARPDRTEMRRQRASVLIEESRLGGSVR